MWPPPEGDLEYFSRADVTFLLAPPHILTSDPISAQPQEGFVLIATDVLLCAGSRDTETVKRYYRGCHTGVKKGLPDEPPQENLLLSLS